MNRPVSSWIRVALTVTVVAGCATAIALACGVSIDVKTVEDAAPASRPSFDQGQLGVVRPSFARRYLVQAYRTLSGAPQVRLDPPAVTPPPSTSTDRWLSALKESGVDLATATRSVELPSGGNADIHRALPDYSSFVNCFGAALETAARRLDEHVAIYGAGSRQVSDWVGAQLAVFGNCDHGDLTLPEPAPAWADTRLRTDREYQTAAAYFYGMEYEEAARRFRAIGDNPQSSWQPFGHYLAGRAMLRHATLTDDERAAVQSFDHATVDLQQALNDARARVVHASAQGLLNLIAARRRPVERRRELSERLAKDATVLAQDLIDYTWLMDQGSSDDDADADARMGGQRDEMTDWIRSIQGAQDTAVERWLERPSDVWLVGALWTAPSDHPAARQLIDAAARVSPQSPAIASASFLRVRLLIARGELTEARGALAALPTRVTRDVTLETQNLLQAERFAVAETLDELLRAAPRRVVPVTSSESSPDPLPVPSEPTWDADVASVINYRLPLTALVTAAESDMLPRRLRVRVAQAAFSRALILDRVNEGHRAAGVLQRLAPALKRDVDRYLAATTDDERSRAATLILLRTPGLSVFVPGTDEHDTFDRVEPIRRFDPLRRHSWCAPEPDHDPVAVDNSALIYGRQPIPFPTFVTQADRAATAAELDRLVAAGDARVYLTRAALSWAQSRPTDADAAEALARAVKAWGLSRCGASVTSDLPKRAFQALHRHFPRSSWARRTRYWYQ